MSTRKVFILDTNVLLSDPEAIFAFEEHEIIIPLAVVEEIDAQKTRNNTVGYHARETSRILDGLRSRGKLNQGINLEGGGSLKIVIDHEDLILPEGLSSSKMDNRILSTAIHLQNKLPAREVVLISEDINIRLIADVYGLKAEPYRKYRVSEENIFSGLRQVNIPSSILDDFFKKELSEKTASEIKKFNLHPQEMLQINVKDENERNVLARFDGKKFVHLQYNQKNPWGISPRNREQQLALELLLNDKIKLVTLVGKAGTGKTLLALAAGLCKVTDEEVYKRLLVARPVIPFGKELGFLPGTKEEKLHPWMQPIFDNMDFILHQSRGSSLSFEYLIEKDLIQIEALTYIRGRSLPDQFIIIDEAQNLTVHEIKTIVSRAGRNSKMIFTGDPYQIDNPYLDLYNNGLTHLANAFRDEKIAGHITLVKGERSELARAATDLL